MEEYILLRLYTKQSQMIYRYLRKQGCYKEETEDIVQESFAKLLVYQDDLDIDKISSWLFRVAINDYKNRLKKRVAHLPVPIEVKDFQELIEDRDKPEKVLLRQEKALSIRACLENLTETNQTLLKLKYEVDLSYKEIGLLLGMEESKVKTYLYRAREAFKKKWSESYE